MDFIIYFLVPAKNGSYTLPLPCISLYDEWTKNPSETMSKLSSFKLFLSGILLQQWESKTDNIQKTEGDNDQAQ